MMVAARDIKALEVVLEEYPLSIGPYFETRPLCLECFKVFQCDASEAYRCSRCNFPLCGPDCEEGSWHKKECDLFNAAGYQGASNLNLNSVSKDFAYASICTLRTLLLKDSDPCAWENVNELLDHNNRRSSDSKFEVKQRGIADFILKHKKGLGLASRFTTSEILHVIGVHAVNNADLALGDVDGKARGKGTGLYPTFARINHSCFCNTKTIKFKDNRLEVRAAIPIPKGTEICNQYVQPRNGTALRQAVLRDKYFFTCRCSRCTDPTELGSYLSAISCTSCKGTSAVVPNNPLDFNSPWQCEICQEEYPAECVQEVLDEALEILSEPCPPSLDVVQHYERLLWRLGTLLHPNNHLLLDAQMHLSNLYGNLPKYRLGDMPNPCLQRKIQLCNQVLETLGKVDPGYSSWRGKMLSELIRAKLLLAKRHFAQGLISKEKLQKVLGEEKFLAMYVTYYKGIFFGRA